MHAYEIPNLRFSLPAGADIARRRFVTVNTSSVAVYPAAGDIAIGVSMDDAEEGNVLTIADGIVMVEAAGEIAAGAKVSTDVAGKAVVATAGSQATESPFAYTAGSIVIGKAITGATASGQIIAVKFI